MSNNNYCVYYNVHGVSGKNADKLNNAARKLKKKYAPDSRCTSYMQKGYSLSYYEERKD